MMATMMMRYSSSTAGGVGVCRSIRTNNSSKKVVGCGAGGGGVERCFAIGRGRRRRTTSRITSSSSSSSRLSSSFLSSRSSSSSSSILVTGGSTRCGGGRSSSSFLTTTTTRGKNHMSAGNRIRSSSSSIGSNGRHQSSSSSSWSFPPPPPPRWRRSYHHHNKNNKKQQRPQQQQQQQRQRGAVMMGGGTIAVAPPLVGYFAHILVTTFVRPSQIALLSSSCEAATAVPTRIAHSSSKKLSCLDTTTTTTISDLYQRLRRIMRMLLRIMKLSITLAPVIAFYPLLLMSFANSSSSSTSTASCSSSKKDDDDDNNNNKKDKQQQQQQQSSASIITTTTTTTLGNDDVSSINSNVDSSTPNPRMKQKRDAHEIALASSSSSSSSHSRRSANNNNNDNTNKNERSMDDILLNWYLDICLYCVECSGAAIIKLCQWASGRPDLFGIEFCNLFMKLQDSTTPHDWKYTEQILINTYGERWYEKIHVHELLGSGCIGQVYRGYVKTTTTKTTTTSSRNSSSNNNNKKDPSKTKNKDVVGNDNNHNSNDNNNNNNNNDDEEYELQEVAIKVLHPNVEEDIHADIDIMRTIAYIATYYFPYLNIDSLSNLKWLNLMGTVNEFNDILKLQLDLRYEGNNLTRFNNNFQYDEFIIFPKLINDYPPQKQILIETYHKGIPILQYAKNHSHDQELLSQMCFQAIRCVCQMIFIDNFVHGDLHSGNVYVAIDDDDHHDDHHENDNHHNNHINNKKKKKKKKPRVILFDVGIVNEHDDHDHEAIVDILAAFIRKQGRIAGRRLIDDSNHRLRAITNHDDNNNHMMMMMGEQAINEEEFIDKIEQLTILASSGDYLMEKLGVYISYICDAASQHHVMLNSAFISAAFAVKVQEGIALALDPSIQIWQVATPVIIESERQRRINSITSYIKQQTTKLMKQLSIILPKEEEEEEYKYKFYNNNNDNIKKHNQQNIIKFK